MMEPESPLAIVEEWRRKTLEYSRQSKDLLLTLFERTFETMRLYLEPDSDNKHIRRALASLEFERNLSVEDDEERETALREVSYGFVQSLHLVLLEYSKIREESDAFEDSHLVESNSPLSIVKEWRRKASDISRESRDVIFSLFERAFDTMEKVLENESDDRRIKRALVTLEFERNLALQDDEEREVSLRDAIYGLVQCLHLTLQELTKIKDQPEIAEEVPMDVIMTKEECRDAALALVNNRSIISPIIQPIDTLKTLQPESILEDQKAEILDHTVKEENPFGMINDILNFPANELKTKEETESITEGEENEYTTESDDVNNKSDIGNSYEDTVDESNKEDDSVPLLETSRNSRRVSSKVVDYTESSGEEEEKEEDDEDYEINDTIESDDINNEGDMGNSYFQDDYVPLLETSRKSRRVSSKVIDYTESSGEEEENKEDDEDYEEKEKGKEKEENEPVAKRRKIQKEEEESPISNGKRRYMECPKCTCQPKNVIGYIQHLRKIHESTLNKNGIHILCSCGATIDSEWDAFTHSNICRGRTFTVQKK